MADIREEVGASEDLADNVGVNASDNQAGNVWTCPECGFKSISRDEYDTHSDSHGNVPATVGSPLDEGSIAVESRDNQILSQFR